jgi:ABC-type transport system involved in multi-copper enzyme maturation permease subunit
MGAALVAEAPFTVAALLISASSKESIISFIMSGLFGVLALLVVVTASLLLTAWLGHRAGLGQ